MESAIRRVASRLLAKTPRVYLAMLKGLRRGSVEKRLYLSIVQRGDIVIDAGANVGYFTMLFADVVGRHGEVHAFEPVPATFQLLSENIRRFPSYRNVRLNCAALGDRDQRTDILIPQGDYGGVNLAMARFTPLNRFRRRFSCSPKTSADSPATGMFA